MLIEDTEISGVSVIVPRLFKDERGGFAESWNRRAWAEHGIDIDFVQDNHVENGHAGTLRGLHFQAPPAAQVKLVRVVRGSVLDVAVDLRRGSPTYGRHVAVELSADNRKQLLVPRDFAHGYCTLVDDTVVLYKADAYYAPDLERGLKWDDPALAIAWPFGAEETLLKQSDTAWPALADLESPFTFDLGTNA